jgi:hypothetical protein
VLDAPSLRDGTMVTPHPAPDSNGAR